MGMLQHPFAPRNFLRGGALLFVVVSFALLNAFSWVIPQTQTALAAPGINRQIPFQGRVVNLNGTTVVNATYPFTFSLYTVPTGGTAIWTETKTLTVSNSIFGTNLGSSTAIPSSVDFNQDALYLGINFNGDGEMTPRIQIAAVPQAINAEKVSGLTVTDTTGTLTIPNSATISFGASFTTSANALSLVTTGATSVTLPTTGVLATLAGTETLTNKTLGVTTFTGQLTPSGSIDLGSSGNRFANLYVATADATNLTVSGTSSLGTVTGGTWQGSVIAAQYGGTGINTSSSNGIPIIAGGSWAVLANGSNNQCLVITSGVPAWGSCSAGGGITGTGAAGQLTYWDSNTTIANAAGLNWNSGASQLGIGTASTVAPLTVRRASSGVVLAVRNTTDSATVLSINDTGDIAANSLTAATGLTVTAGTVSLPAGEIGNTELANSSLTVSAGTNLTGGGSVSLGGSTTLNVVGNPSFATSVTAPTINATSSLQLNGVSVNTSGTLSNVAYLSQANAFTAGLSITSATTPQLSVRNDVSNRLDVSTGTTGATTLTAVGSNPAILLDATAAGGEVQLSTPGGSVYLSSSGSISLSSFGVSQLDIDVSSIEVVNGAPLNGDGTSTINGFIWQGAPVGAAYGGTGQNSYATGDLLYATGTSALGRRAIGSTGDCLVVSAGVPTWGSCAQASSTLQAAYGNGNAIALTDARDFAVTLANTTTDSNVIFNIASGSTGRFAVQGNGTDIFEVDANGTTITSGGLTVTAGTVSLPAGEIGNSELANSSLTVSAGTNLSGGGSVALGSSTTLNVVNNPTFTGLVTASNTNATALAVTGAPAASATQSLFRLGNAIVGGSANGTYLGINAGSGYTGNLLDLQVNNVRRLVVGADGSFSASTDASQLDFSADGLRVSAPNMTSVALYTGGGIDLSDNSFDTEFLINTMPVRASGGLISNGGLNVTAGTVTLPNGSVSNAYLANSSLTVTAGAGLTGGGSVSLGSSVSLSLPNVGTAATYGSAIQVPVFTTDAQGRITGVTNTTIAGIDAGTLDGLDSTDFLRSTASTTFSGTNARTLTVQSSLTAGARSAALLNITQADNVTNNSTAPLVNIGNSDAGSTGPLLVVTNVTGGQGISISDSVRGAVLSGDDLTLSNGVTNQSLTITTSGITSPTDTENFTINLMRDGVSELIVTNNEPGQVANLNLIDGSLLTNNVTRITNAGVLQNVTYNGGVIAAQYGGTGQSSYAVGDLLYASGTTTLSKLVAGSNGQCLVLAAGVPSWSSCATAAVTLQAAYDNGNAIGLTNARNLIFTLTNTATDPNFLINIASGSSGRFEVQSDGSSIAYIESDGIIQTQGGGVLGGAGVGTNVSGFAFSGGGGGAQVQIDNDVGNVVLGTTALTLERSIGTYELVVNASGTSELTVQNTTASQVANLNLLDGSLLTAGTTRLTNAGALQNITSITTSGAYTQSGSGANTFSGATTFSAAGTALSVTNSATIGGTLTVTGAINGQTISSAASFTGTVAAATSFSAPLYTSTGNLALTAGGTGTLAITTSTQSSGTTGAITLNSGNATSTGASGSVTISTGTSVNANTGSVVISTGTSTATSGGITIDSGYGDVVSGVIAIAGTNASGLTLGRTGLQAVVPGTLAINTAASALRLGSGANGTTLTSTATTARAISFPDAAGTIALTTSNVTSATNLAGGAAGQVPYQSGVGATAFIGGSAGQVFVSNGSSAPGFINLASTITAGTNISITGTTNPTINVVSNPTFSGLVTGQAGLIVTGAAVDLNVSSNFATNINTGTSTGTVTIGNSANTVGVAAPTTFSATGTALNVTNNAMVGGALTISSLTQGSILFAGSSGVVSQANSLMFYDTTNSSVGFGATRSGAISSTNAFFQIQGTSSNTRVLDVKNNSGSSLLTVNSLGNVIATLGPTGLASAGVTQANSSVTLGGRTVFNNTGVSSADATMAQLQLTSTNLVAGDADGTFLGLNALTGYAGDLVNFQLNGAQRLTVTAAGALTTASTLTVSSGGANITGGIDNNSGGITETGAVAGVTTLDATGLITGSGGLTITGAGVNLNASSNFPVNVATGTSTGAVSIGGGSNTFALNSTALDISTAGAVTGILSLSQASGGWGLDSSGQISSNASGGAVPFSASVAANGGQFIAATTPAAATTAALFRGGSRTFTGSANGTAFGANFTTGFAGDFLNMLVNDVSILRVTAAGNITTSGTLGVTGLITGSAGLTVTGADVNLNVSSNFATNINTGTSTGNVTIGNSANNLIVSASNLTVTDDAGFIFDSPGSGETVLSTGYDLLRIQGGIQISLDASTSIPSGYLTLGNVGNNASLILSGSTSGAVTIQPQAAAGTYNFNLPTTAGTSGFVLTSAGGASSPMTWTDPAALAVRWSSIANPTGNQSLSMGTNTTSWNYATGTAANDLFNLTTDASANGTGSLFNVQTGASSTVNPVRVRAGSVESLFVNASGNVGIGTTSPGSNKLAISTNGTSLLTLTHDATNGLIGTSAGALNLRPASGIVALNTAATQNRLRVFGSGGSNYIELTNDNTNSIISSSSGELQLQGSGTNQFILGSTGAAMNLIFEESSTISGQGTNTITLGQSGDIFNLNASGVTYNVGTLTSTGATLATTNTSNVAFTINGPSGLTANLLNLAVNSSNRLTVTTAGALSTVSSLTSTVTGANALTLSGAPQASTTSSLVQLGSAIASGSASGTYLGLNASGGFTGNLIDMQVGGSSRFKVTSAGDAIFSSATLIGGITSSSNEDVLRATNTTPISDAAGAIIKLGNDLAAGSANGNFIGVNSASGFGGNFIQLENGGTAILSVSGKGRTTLASTALVAADWTQVNTSGFGSSANSAFTGQTTFGSATYIAVGNASSGVSIYRSTNGTSWTLANTAGFGSALNLTATLTTNGGALYAATSNTTTGTQIYRSFDGTTWTQVNTSGFGSTGRHTTTAITSFGGAVYASTNTGETYRSFDGTTWTLAADLGGTNGSGVRIFFSANGYLIAGSSASSGGAILQRSLNGTTWTQLSTAGLGNTNNTEITSGFYTGDAYYFGTRNTTNGANIYRSYDLSSFNLVNTAGFGSVNNSSIRAMTSFNGAFFATTSNSVTGSQVHRSTDGTIWAQVNTSGFGSTSSNASYVSFSFKGSLFVAVDNATVGGQIWSINTGLFESASGSLAVESAQIGGVNIDNAQIRGVSELSANTISAQTIGVKSLQVADGIAVNSSPTYASNLIELDANDSVVLTTSVTGATKISPWNFTGVLQTTTAETSFTNITASANSTTAYNIYRNSAALNDRTYFGFTDSAFTAVTYTETSGSGGATSFEVCTGLTSGVCTTWTAISGGSDTTSALTASGAVSWTNTLTKGTVNGINAFWLRMTVTSGMSVQANGRVTLRSFENSSTTNSGIGFLLQANTTANAASWSSGGTYFGILAETTFAGNFIDLRTSASSLFTVSGSGGVTVAPNSVSTTPLTVTRIGSQTADTIVVGSVFVVDTTGKLASSESLPGIPLVGVDPNSGATRGDLTTSAGPLRPTAGAGLSLNVSAGSAYTADNYTSGSRTTVRRCVIPSDTSITMAASTTEYVYLIASTTDTTTGKQCTLAKNATLPAFNAQYPVVVIAKVVSGGAAITSVADTRFFIGSTLVYATSTSSVEPGSVVIQDTAADNRIDDTNNAGSYGVFGITAVGNTGSGLAIVTVSGNAWAQAVSTMTRQNCATTSSTTGAVDAVTTDFTVCVGRSMTAASSASPAVLLQVTPN